eukprot:3919904-Rhodomonas_salina.4
MSKFDAENVPKKQDQNSNRDLVHPETGNRLREAGAPHGTKRETENDALSRAGEKAKAKRQEFLSSVPSSRSSHFLHAWSSARLTNSRFLHRKDAVSEEIERIRQESMAAGVEMDAQTDTETLIRSGAGLPQPSLFHGTQFHLNPPSNTRSSDTKS